MSNVMSLSVLFQCGSGPAICRLLSPHEQECRPEFGHRRGGSPEGRRAAHAALAVPIRPVTTNKQTLYITGKFKESQAT